MKRLLNIISIYRKKIYKTRPERIIEIEDRIAKITGSSDGSGIFCAPMDPQDALNELCRYFLGTEWYTINPVSQRQVNTEIVYEIEKRFRGCRK